MFFLLRTVFWLSVVFLSLPWPEDSADLAPVPAAAERKMHTLLGRAAGMARAELEKECLRAPAACLKAAAQLSGMAAGPAFAGKGKETRRAQAVDAEAAAN